MDYDLLTIDSDIDDSLIEEVLKIKRTDAERLIIVVHTYGGDPFVAYRVMQHLDAIYGTIDIVIPDKAMSAGTLMCMGSDHIFMNYGSCLGPLDLQVPHPRDGGQISTIDIKESTYDIFGLTTRVTKQLYIQAIRDMKLGKVTAAKLAHESAVELLKPMVEKIDPFHLHASYRGASVGQKYAFILLATRMMRSNIDQARKTSKILAEDYEMHSYAITMDEAQNYLQLNVKNIIELEALPEVQSVIESMPKNIQLTRVRKPKLLAKAKAKSDSDNKAAKNEEPK